MNQATVALFAVVAVSAVNAADVSITPPAGGGFTVNAQGGTSVFRVDAANGGVYIPSLPSELANTPLCWNSNSGLLSACLGGGSGHDVTVPTITSTAPLVATQGNQTYSITCTDDNELLFCVSPDIGAMGPGVKSFTTVQNSGYVNLNNGGYSRVATSTDMAGNSSKLKITVQTPPVGIALKSFKTITPSTIPSGFDCRSRPYQLTLDGSVINQIFASENYPGLGYAGWTQAEGYVLSVSVSGPSLNGINLRSDGADVGLWNSGNSFGPLRTPLAATTATLPRTWGGSGGGSGTGSYADAYRGTVEYVAASDELRLTVVMECGTTPVASSVLTWTEGVPFVLTARP